MRKAGWGSTWPAAALVALSVAPACGSSESNNVGSTEALSQGGGSDHCDENEGPRWSGDDDKPGNGPKCKKDGGAPPPPPPSECDASIPPAPDAGSPAPDSGAACGFTPYNDGLVGGQIADVAYDPRSPGVAWAAAGPRLFKSTDSGATWSMTWEGEFGFRKIALPTGGDPKVLYAATSGGVAKTTDGGVTWKVISLDGLSISSLLVHPAEPLRMYAGVRGAGIIRSNDGGVSWTSVDYGVPYGDYPSMVGDPSNPDIVFVVAMEQDGVGTAQRSSILRTSTGGASWVAVQQNEKTITYELATCAADPNIMVASAANYYGGASGVLRSTDRGLTWSTTAGLAGKLVTDVALSPSDCNTLYAVHYGVGLKRSSDGGVTFSGPLTAGIPFYNNFPRHVAVDPSDVGRLLGASQGGVLYTANAGATFSVVGGVMNLAIRAVDVSPLDPSRLWIATWGSGAWVRPDGATPWSKVGLEVDYMFTVTADPVAASRTWLGTWSYPFVSTGGVTFSKIELPKNPFGFAIDPSNSSTVYVATQIGGLFKSTDGGTTWASANGAVSAWDTGAGKFIDFRSAVVDRTNPARVLVGSNLRGVFRSEDGGATLASVAPTLGDKLVSRIVQGPDGAFYAVVDGSGIAKSTDGGATFGPATVGLPSLNVAGMAVDAVSGDLYSTSNLGVFRSNDGAATWTAFGGACLPVGGAGQAVVLGAGATRKLVVATGRGIYAHAL